MVTISERIESLRTERGMSRPALAAALGFPKVSIEKFETGRQTPTREQQKKMASYFGVSLFYLRGESSDRTKMENWLDTGIFSEPAPSAAPRPDAAASVQQASGGGSMLDAFLASKAFHEAIRTALIDVLQSPEGQRIISAAVAKAKD